MVTAERPEAVVTYNPEGALRDLFTSHDPEILVEGAAGTGKTFAICHLIHALCSSRPGCRILMTRKTLTALTASALVTFREKVAPANADFFGGSKVEPASFRYDNGSRIVVAGLDNPSKILSSEYDLIFVNEATEVDEETWETLTGRLRNGVLKHPRIIGDCNPTYDRHWLIKRVQNGQTKRIHSTHDDNPTLTQDYLETLSNMTGTRRQRFFLGEWVGMENAIYADLLDADTQFVELPERPGWTGRGAGGMDFGRIHLSAVLGATEDHAGVLWVRECWTGHNSKQDIMAAAERQRSRYKIPRHCGVTDPLQDWAAQDLGWKIAKSGAGSRKGRIQRVRAMLEQGALRFDRYGEGVQDLWDELHMYRYEVVETDTNIDDVVVRKEDDRVAALEYAVEAWAMNGEPIPSKVSAQVAGMRSRQQSRSVYSSWKV